MPIVRLLKSQVFLYAALAAAFFCLAFGLEVGRSAGFERLRLEEKIRPALSCPDGTAVKKHAHHLRGLAAQALFELGDLGRMTLKECLCQGFGSGKCLALKMEIFDRMD